MRNCDFSHSPKKRELRVISPVQPELPHPSSNLGKVKMTSVEIKRGIAGEASVASKRMAGE